MHDNNRFKTFYRRPADPDPPTVDHEIHLFSRAADKKLRTKDHDNVVRTLRYEEDDPNHFLIAVFDNGASVLTTGIKGDVSIPINCVISKWNLLADVSGSIVVDIWKDTYANYPPTSADSITASAKPTISSALKAESATLTGWTTAINAGDTLRFNINSVTSIKRCTLTLTVRAI